MVFSSPSMYSILSSSCSSRIQLHLLFLGFSPSLGFGAGLVVGMAAVVGFAAGFGGAFAGAGACSRDRASLRSQSLHRPGKTVASPLPSSTMSFEHVASSSARS
jgi:hypothetical protein